MENPEQKPRLTSESAAFTPQNDELASPRQGGADEAASQAADKERFSRLRQWSGPAGRLACTMACAAGGLYAALHGAHYETNEIANTGIWADISIEPVDAHAGLNVDSLVDVQFNDMSALPVGVHVSPKISKTTFRYLANSGGMSAAIDQSLHIRDEGIAELRAAGTYFGERAALGIGAGALGGAALSEIATIAYRARRGKDSANEPLRQLAKGALQQALAGSLVTTAVIGGSAAGVAKTSYNPEWFHDWSASGGIISEAMNIPKEMDKYSSRDQQAAAYARSIFQVLDELDRPAPNDAEPAAAFSVMFTSDRHGRDTYRYMWNDMRKYDVKLIVDTGDIVEGGFSQELTPKFLNDLKKTAAMAPVLFVGGNHDPLAVREMLAKIPNVYVLEDATVNAYGLQIAGAPDPTGAMPEGGPADAAARKAIELQDADSQAALTNKDAYFDMMLTHDPDELDRLQKDFGTRMRLGAAGHVHVQNAPKDIQHSNRIRLIEGTTGAGGNWRRYYKNMPGNGIISYSIMPVGANCQFLGVKRYNLHDPVMPDLSGDQPPDSVINKPFTPQPVNPQRTCAVEQGISG
ncbi:MAG TPA: metallophosphoesterase, partial [Candidatus Saccharimonadales bacterium]|nr:metallophosphoesterase [Candidatus Saccharimonadales bacterium]